MKTRVPGAGRLRGARSLSACIPVANAQDASGRDDRLSLMVAGHKLTNTDGGWGAAAVWLHNFSADTLIGLGAETQEIKSDISDARWTFGRLSFNHGFGAAQTRTNLYFDASVGSGHDDLHNYDYSIVTVGVYQNLTQQLTLQLEDKQVNVDTVRRQPAEARLCSTCGRRTSPRPSAYALFGQRQSRHEARDGAHRRILEDR